MENYFNLTKQLTESMLAVRATLINNDLKEFEENFKILPATAATMKYTPQAVQKYFNTIPEKTIYALEDCFFIKWVVFRLNGKFVVFGPYFDSPQEETLVHKTIKMNSFDISFQNPIKTFYNSVPVVNSEKILTIAKILIKNVTGTSEDFKLKEVSPTVFEKMFAPDQTQPDEEEVFLSQIERRYELENKICADITQGNEIGAMQIWKILSTEVRNTKRLSDPLLNRKVNCIVVNTLLRRAAEKSCVHPLYLESLFNSIFSSVFAAKSVDEVCKLQESFIIQWCTLISKHSLAKYSPIIRQALNYINMHLSTDIHLNEIAEATNVSPNYLSALFNKEMKQSISSYINKKRIDRSIVLLQAGFTPIDQIADFAGFNDINYFTRVFKQIMGVTPSEYRKFSEITF